LLDLATSRTFSSAPAPRRGLRPGFRRGWRRLTEAVAAGGEGALRRACGGERSCAPSAANGRSGPAVRRPRECERQGHGVRGHAEQREARVDERRADAEVAATLAETDDVQDGDALLDDDALDSFGALEGAKRAQEGEGARRSNARSCPLALCWGGGGWQGRDLLSMYNRLGPTASTTQSHLLHALKKNQNFLQGGSAASICARALNPPDHPLANRARARRRGAAAAEREVAARQDGDGRLRGSEVPPQEGGGLYFKSANNRSFHVGVESNEINQIKILNKQAPPCAFCTSCSRSPSRARAAAGGGETPSPPPAPTLSTTTRCKI
jgi:hypothetical protein